MNALFSTAAQLASNPIVSAISQLYGVATNLNDFLDEHIERLKANASATVRATGNILDAAKFGFGLGYVSSLVIISVGQIILGNPLTAVVTLVKGATATNPVAMTCGAIGAIYYGWTALSDEERNVIVNRVTEAFEIGAELVKSFVGFLLKNLGQSLTAENLAEYKRMIATAAADFGTSLSDITRSVKDRISDARVAVTQVFGKSADLALHGAQAAVDAAAKGGSHAVSTLQDGTEAARRYFGKSRD